MKKIIFVLLALALSSTAACGTAGEDDDWDLEENEQPVLEGTYVSGHLGNYRDCPDDGYTPESSTDSTGRAGAPAEPDGDGYAGDCAEGQDCGGFTMNCEDAQMTVRLTNPSSFDATGLQASTIELYDADGVLRATLPLMDTVDTATNESFDGKLKAGEKITLRVEFLGPEDPYMLLSTDDASGDAGRIGSGAHGTVGITFRAATHKDLLVESSELYPVPSVDT